MSSSRAIGPATMARVSRASSALAGTRSALLLELANEAERRDLGHHGRVTDDENSRAVFAHRRPIHQPVLSLGFSVFYQATSP